MRDSGDILQRGDSPKSVIQSWYQGHECFDEKYSDGFTKKRWRKTKSQRPGDVANRTSELTMEAAVLSNDERIDDSESLQLAGEP